MINDSIRTAEKRHEETKTMREIIRIYCHGHHHHRQYGEDLCPSCRDIADYAASRIARCPHMEEKTFCKFCKTHCYAPSRREDIRRIMRWAGPRMLIHDPLSALHHMLLQISSHFRH